MTPSYRQEFHAHLDACSQCSRNPFALCFEGAKLLRLAAEQEGGMVLPKRAALASGDSRLHGDAITKGGKE